MLRDSNSCCCCILTQQKISFVRFVGRYNNRDTRITVELKITINLLNCGSVRRGVFIVVTQTGAAVISSFPNGMI